MTKEGPIEADVAIEAGVVSSIAPQIEGLASHIIDASGCLVGPGFVDLHAHFRDPGQTWKEDLETGSRTAAHGGYTAVVVMPNTEPAIDTSDAVVDISERAKEVGLVTLGLSGALTRGRQGVEATDIEALYEAGVRIFSDDGDSVEDLNLLRLQMLRTSLLPGAVVSQHAEDVTQTDGGHLHDGEMAERHGLGGLSSAAESDVVRRDLELTEETGCHYHCQHVSAAETVDLIRRAKERRLQVTAEVTPHHLYFTEGDLEVLDTNLKMYPPVRSESDRQALIGALREGTIDAVATDHAPHSAIEKNVPFSEAPRGVIGLETAASATWMILEDPKRFFEVMSVTPAAIAGMDDQGQWPSVGGSANVVVFDPVESWVPEDFASRSANSPFIGRDLTGRVLATVHKGQLTYELVRAND